MRIHRLTCTSAVPTNGRSQILPKVGRLVVFSNTDVNGRRYNGSLHSSGTFSGTEHRRKWVFNLWFRAHAFQGTV